MTLLALANMVKGGEPFKVVSFPDYNGGRSVCVENKDYELGDFEYTEWKGSPMEYAQQQPSFEECCEPFHEERREWKINALQLMQREIRQA